MTVYCSIDLVNGGKIDNSFFVEKYQNYNEIALNSNCVPVEIYKSK